MSHWTEIPLTEAHDRSYKEIVVVDLDLPESDPERVSGFPQSVCRIEFRRNGKSAVVAVQVHDTMNGDGVVRLCLVRRGTDVVRSVTARPWNKIEEG